MFYSKQNQKKGFTLIEMLVAVFIFSIVMVIAVGAIFNIVNANKTSQGLKSVLDNLDSALNDMSSSIRYGTNYHCDASSGTITTAQSCTPSQPYATSFSFLNKDNLQVTYRFNSSDPTNQKIQECYGSTCTLSNSSGWIDLTSPDVNIQNLYFYVAGATAGVSGLTTGDNVTQPQVLITLNGAAKNGPNKSSFNIETMVTQRNPTCKGSMVSEDICNN